MERAWVQEGREGNAEGGPTDCNQQALLILGHFRIMRTFRVRRDIGFGKDGAVWIPALSAIGAGFAIGLAAIGSGVGQAAAGSPNKCRGHRDTCTTPQFFFGCVQSCFRLARLGCSVQRAVKHELTSCLQSGWFLDDGWVLLLSCSVSGHCQRPLH